MKHRDIADITRIFVDKTFSLGDKEKGWDCLSMILEYCRRLNVSLPDKFKGFTEKNYAGRWQNGKGRKEFKEFLYSLGHKIETNYATAGDLMVFEGDKWVFPGIYLGNDHVLLCFEKGVKVAPAKFFRNKLMEVRRVCPQ